MKIGMLLAPCEQTLYTGLSIPPHTLAVMTGYLRGIGHEVDQYDLETDLLDLYESGRASKADFEFIFSKEDVLGFLRGEDKPHIRKIIEAFLDGKDFGSLDIVGMSLGGSFHWMPIHLGLMIAKYIKDRYAIPVVIGGNNIFYLNLFKDIYGELWEHILSAFRFVIVGSGLEAVDIIASHLAHDPAWLPKPGELPGFAYLKNGVMQHETKAKNLVVRPDFDGLRLDYYMNYLQDPATAKNPDEVERQNLEQMFKWPPNLIQYANQVYRRRQQKDRVKKLTIPYVFNYHCPYQCAFCAESDKNNQVVMGEAAKVVDDLEFLSKKYDTPYFYFYNNYFNLSKTFVLAFCEEVKRRKLKIHWQDCARFNGLDDDLMVKLKEAGCATLWFGMETGGERLMTILNKKLNLGQIHDGLNLCKKHGVWANLEMIVGFPHETREDFQKTVRFINDNIENINFFQNNRYFVVPNSTIGLHPEQFEIELVRAMNTYESLLKDNLEWYRSGKGLGSKPNNFNIHGFNEIGGRKHPEILEEGQRRLILMHKMERKEFVETRQMLVLLNSLAKKKAQQKKAEAAAEA